MDNKQICCICNKEFTGFGNNAQPYKEGICCNECNSKYVIPKRLEIANQDKLDKDTKKDTN